MADPSERQGPGAGALDTAVTADSRRGPIAVDAGTLEAAPGGPRIADDDHGFPVRGWDRHEFIARIGAGGMGTVYYARHPRLGRDVALNWGTGVAWSPGDSHLLVAVGFPQILLVDPARITRNLWRAIPRCLGLDERTRLLGEPRLDAEAGRDDCEAMLRCLAEAPDGDGACLGSLHARQSARTMNLD